MVDGQDARSLGNAIRHFRLRRGFTMEQLAQAAGLSTAMISKVESGSGNPSIASLRQIASALNVPVTLFFAQEESEQAADPVLLNHKRIYAYKGAKYTILSTPISNVAKFYMLEVEPGASIKTAKFADLPHDAYEQGLVLEGRLSFTVGGVTHELGPGDSISYPGTLHHTWVNQGSVPVKAVWVVTINPPGDEPLSATS